MKGGTCLLLDHDKKIIDDLNEVIKFERAGILKLTCADDTGQVYFIGGRIAWVTASTVSRTFSEYLAERTSLSSPEITATFERCRSTGEKLGESLIELGLLEEDTVHRLLLEQISEVFQEILSWQSVESTFVTDIRVYKQSLTFEPTVVFEAVAKLKRDGKLLLGGIVADQILQALKPNAPAS